MLIDILHIAFRGGVEGHDRVDQIFTIQITVHQQFPAGLFNTLAAPARVVRVGFAAGAGEDNLRVIEMRFAAEVKAFRERFCESYIGDGAAVGKSAQRGLQRICKAAGFDDRVRALLPGQLFDFQTDISAYWVQTVVCPMTTGDLTAVFDWINADNH